MKREADTTTNHNKEYRTFAPIQIPEGIEEKAKEAGLKSPEHPAALGLDVFWWPEFIALAKRLHLDLEKPTTAVTIRVDVNDVVRITQEYNGQDGNKPRNQT